MSDLISGKEAWIAKSNGDDVEWLLDGINWQPLTNSEFLSWASCRFVGDTNYKFRLKPRTITLNGIEIPAPFEPKEGEEYFYISDEYDGGYGVHEHDNSTIEIAAWRTKEEIKQVVEALRSVFK